MSAVSGPATTEELIQRCRSASNVKEQIVLRELVTSMIYTFEEQPLPSFMPEVVQLASIATDEEYRTIIATFANRIIHGTADGDVLSPKLLLNFTRVLRRAPDVLSAETAHLGSVLDSLRERLEKAAHRAEVATQYHLCRVLSRLLDAMLDIKITGLNREYLHQPLLLKLRGLQNNQEPRLAEAAGYAYQGLLSISNDEGTFEAFWRHTGTLVLAASKIAGAVPTLDPSKIFDATPEVMNLLSTISSMVGGVQRIYSASQESKDVVEALRALSRQEGWYVALRYSEILLTAGAYQMLEDFIQRSPCYDMERFWSGLLAQLERAWVGGSSHTKGSVKRVIEIAIPLIKAKYGLAQRWIGVVADTLDQPTWRPEPVDVRHKIRFWKNDDYNSGNLLVFSAVDSSLQADPSKLLLKALPGCEEAMRFYVDSELRRQYTKGGLLEIKRLSGELLDMEQCYINLTLVEHSGGLESGQKDKNQASAFTLFSRLQVGPDAADQNVPLPSIFKARRLLDGTKIHPRRILIRGRAGVGKTTLCKKIVHDFLNGQLWGDHFDRLIWIPLRSLKSKASPKELLQDYFKYCPSQLGSESLVSALWASMFGPNNAQTLLLLDGLDEISDERSSGAGDMTDSLKDLLNYSNVIITSRPSAVGLPGVNQFDLELETVGFQQNQVTAYLNKVVVDSTKRKEMQEFINQHCLIQGLIQIPIQLDALCYSWDDELRKKDMPKTMTALYQAIEHNLWKKDVLRLEKRNERVLLSENQTQKLRQRSQLQAFVGREMEMLELFAFTGLQNDIIEFSPRHRDRLYENSGILGMSDDILDGSSFLRTSDLSKRASTTYHFLHLTFQEFFAAQYFVRCWVSGQDITLLSLRASQKAATTIAPDKLVEEEKYNGRYDIFWRFVAGLLYFKDTAQLYRFFQKIEEKPHDMLGPSHLRLLMHCFSEVPCSDQKLPVEKIRKKLEDRCLQWTNWECSTFGYFALCKETEFPDSVVFQILAEQPYPAGKTKLKLFLSALGARNQQPSVGIQELVWDILRQDPPWEIKRRCLVVISPQTSLPNKILDDLVSMLTDSDPKKRRVPFSILGTVPEWPLSEQVEAKMVHCLSDTDAKVRTIAYDFLQSWPERPMRFIDTIGAFLEDPAVDVRCLSALLLANVSTLPENTMESLLPTLAMSDSNTKQVFLDVLESDEKKSRYLCCRRRPSIFCQGN
ncbi:hypothetical protein N7462_007420 [Penicillium macrosclerotiorum]|uniref:uncharacterized protein n=1 Tax=Penicillium macrosclerotiorum TaxID=303699 RepID=UPI0025478EEC|nr:uncharacterized protein N7462_007420 [Penicillium macrosclerotiorum]KAJ5679176.1 hypothetical protein N7462_007420 [Penicillium macrosclerotiorum]